MARKSSDKGENAPLDRTDKKILRQLDEVLQDDDPPPADLVEKTMRALDKDE